VRKLLAFGGVVLSCASAPPPAASPVASAPAAAPVASAPAAAPAPLPVPPLPRDIDWCDRAYPWTGGPLTSVLLKDCSATYEETGRGPGGEHAAWTWRIESVQQDRDGKVALVTLHMYQNIGPARAVYQRTYRFFREGRHIALIGADPVVRIDAAPGGPGAP
jgi:hypothetical protein